MNAAVIMSGKIIQTACSMEKSPIARFYGELKRRKVLRVGAVYAVVSWVVVEIASVMFPELLLPDWSVRLVIALLGALLTASGYSEALANTAQPASALVAIRLCMGIIPAVLVLLGLVVMRRWPERSLHLQQQA